MKKLVLFCYLAVFIVQAAAQSATGCTFKAPLVTIHFGAGDDVGDINTTALSHYRRYSASCPYDGTYAYTSYTSDCFSGDWFTLPEDHTPGDAAGNMMLVNASYDGGMFFNTRISGLKGNTIYQFGVWMMNVCRISDKCPFPLLPAIIIRLKTLSGKTIAQFATGDLPRREAPHWTQYRAVFTMPAAENTILVTMEDTSPGGCGNDFALDDITLRECVKPVPTVVEKKPVTVPPKQTVVAAKPVVKKEVTNPAPAAKKTTSINQAEPKKVPHQEAPIVKQNPVLPPPPSILTTRANPLVKQIETEAGEIAINLYDNGEIDGDTVTVYHNNELLVAKARLSQKPISFRIAVDAAHPHHELVLVADNLGSIPPNTSLMIVTVNNKRYQVFISSSEQKNAKVVFDLK